ncbi:hypothetical protein GGS23DRAFT_48477 [Durotheca rogersii]|uniref:uncharacterized protein n=1 Tax=Durotheca rogersii TaxID=419775 RepID=UPI00222000A5|nr:uncharacterized protein GGS23DRAFT_48477 [Durotheca rogersii]KAI5863020.1 hypothetical protein GGS23DRAFT_48477 [Durotheca rogersii]
MVMVMVMVIAMAMGAAWLEAPRIKGDKEKEKRAKKGWREKKMSTRDASITSEMICWYTAPTWLFDIFSVAPAWPSRTGRKRRKQGQPERRGSRVGAGCDDGAKEGWGSGSGWGGGGDARLAAARECEMRKSQFELGEGVGGMAESWWLMRRARGR